MRKSISICWVFEYLGISGGFPGKDLAWIGADFDRIFVVTHSSNAKPALTGILLA
jgi:hypothetical protein